MFKTLKFKIPFSFILISLIFTLNSMPAKASSFTNTYLRLDKQTPSAPLSGTVCAQPSAAGAGTEAKVAVTFPSDFSISSNPSNWTTDLNNLPTGASNWPSIGSTATGVSGHTVTFSGGDLTANMLYCFNFSGASSTTGAVGKDSGVITTKNSSNTIIDQTTYYLNILANNQIEVTATVPPNASYLPISIESTTPGSNFPQNTTLNYKITYGL